MFVLLFLASVVLVLTLIHLTGRYNEQYWKKRGVVFHPRNKIIGPFWDFLRQDRALFEIFHDMYKTYRNEPAVGFGSFLSPALYVVDPVNVQHVLQSDFQSFNQRAFEPIKGDLLTDNITFMHGPRWKLMRQNLSPLFTATKLKNMYYIVDKSAQDFVSFLKENPDKLKNNVFHTLNTFCSAAIGAAVFGIGTKSIFDSPFLKMARTAMQPTPTRNFKFALAGISQPLMHMLGLKIWKEFENFFVDAIKQVLRQRETENVKKHDFADICLSIKKSGTMRDPETGTELEPTDELLAAQAFFFFLAGVEPSATAMFCTFVELGKNPEILEKLHKEIDETMEKCKGEVTYDVVMEMEYLDKVLYEALRIFPPVGFLTRKCNRDTVLPVGNIKITKGTKMFTPLFEMQRDPKYYPNPEVFDPERFAHDSKSGEISYMPFGKGGRICIGVRYARLQVKAGILHLLHNYTIKPIHYPNEKFSKQQFQVRPAGVDVEFIPRNLKVN